MKTLTLSEAFEKATNGPLQVEIGMRQPPKLVPENDGKPVAILAACHTMQQEENNAALLAHCFNNLQDLVSALEECKAWFILDYERIDPIFAHRTEVGKIMIQQIENALAKANQVTLP